MGIDIVHLVRRGAASRMAISIALAAPLRRAGARSCGRHRRCAVTHQLGVDLGAPLLGVGEFLQQQHAGTSPRTKPLRSLSKGMEARLGSGFWLRAFIEVKPPMARGVTAASVPPQSITSA